MMIKNILIPIDFSDYSKISLQYACELAAKHNSRVIIAHAFQLQYTSAYVPAGNILDELKNTKKDLILQMKKLFGAIKGSAGIKSEFICVEELAVDLILKVIKEKNIDLVVIGTRGGSVLKNALFGSNAAHVIDHADCPVITIPANINRPSFDKIIFATDLNSKDNKELIEVIEMARPFKSEIVVLHLSDKDKKEDSLLLKKMMEKVSSQINYKKLSFISVPSAKILDKLRDYTESSEADLLVLSTHHRTLLEKIFRLNVAKRMSYQLKVPLMVFHR
ncbi:MAG: universal stress protein [Bacteroidia bacterium]